MMVKAQTGDKNPKSYHKEYFTKIKPHKQNQRNFKTKKKCPTPLLPASAPSMSTCETSSSSAKEILDLCNYFLSWDSLKFADQLKKATMTVYFQNYIVQAKQQGTKQHLALDSV